MTLPSDRYCSTIAVSADAWAWLQSEADRQGCSLEEVLTSLIEHYRVVTVAATELHPEDEVRDFHEETIERWIKELP